MYPFRYIDLKKLAQYAKLVRMRDLTNARMPLGLFHTFDIVCVIRCCVCNVEYAGIS